MEHTELPTERRLEELRAEGEVPYSPLATAGLSAIVLVTALVLGAPWGWALMLEYFASLDGSAPPPDPKSFLGLVVMPLVAAGMGAALGGFSQTRGVIKMQRLAARPGRLVPWSYVSALSYIGLILLRGAWLAGLFCLIAVIGWSLLPVLYRLLNGPIDLGLLDVTARRTALGAIGVGAVLFVGGFAASRLLFRLRHRMTREEVRQESFNE